MVFVSEPIRRHIRKEDGDLWSGNLDTWKTKAVDQRPRPVNPGTQQVVWDGRNDSGGTAGSGVYLYRVVVGHEKVAGKMVLLK